jgi:hypothetical protein
MVNGWVITLSLYWQIKSSQQTYKE